MNEWIMVGIVIVGVFLAMGGLAWVMGAIKRSNTPPKS